VLEIFLLCWNDCFRKIFGYKRHESVKELQFFCGELPFNLIYDLQRWKFLNGAHLLSDNLSVVYKFQVHVIHELSDKYGSANSVGQLRKHVRQFFSSSLL